MYWYKTGLEIEFSNYKNFNKETLFNIINELKINVTLEDEKYNHNIWKIKDDESCGFELISPIINNEKELDNLKIILVKINDYIFHNKIDLKKIINKNCGLHLHIDAIEAGTSLYFFKRMINLFSLLENKFIYKIIDKDRVNNKNCKKIDYTINYNNKQYYNFWKKINFKISRYYGLNILSYLKYNTIEIRYYQSTIDYQEIYYWIKLIHSIFECVYNEKDFFLKEEIGKYYQDKLCMDYSF